MRIDEPFDECEPPMEARLKNNSNPAAPLSLPLSSNGSPGSRMNISANRRAGFLIACAATFSLIGCSDPTRPHLDELARRRIKTVAWTHPNIDAVPREMQMMHLSAERAEFTARQTEEFLAPSPPLDRKTLELVRALAKHCRTREEQYRSAISDGRSKLDEPELEIALECARNEVFLMGELFDRIGFDELVADMRANAE